jgi:2-keto-4-pentenoate hydratase/2-oxohepta-3-ene-1,7-dioic acid hydratase in catechol pathway
MTLRFASFVRDGAHRFGVVDGDIIGIVDNLRWPDLAAVVRDGGWRAAAASARRSIDANNVKFLPPLHKPGKIICVGVNYPDRNAEYKDGQDAPQYPSLFVRFPQSFVGHGQPLIRPRASDQFDYEGEIALVIGKPGRHIPEERALAHIAAVTLCNDGSVRDWIRHGKFNVTQGKNFDRSGSIGPWLVPFEDEDQIADIRLTTRVNGDVRQDDRTSRMVFPFRTLISYVSTFTTLSTGDILVTGTPTGAGARLNPPRWLKPGDIVEVEAEGIGILRNPVADEEWMHGTKT